MMPEIHSTALVDEAVQMGKDVVIGAFAIVQGPVVLGERVKIEPHAQVLGDTVVGEGTVIGRGAVIGGDPQDLGFDPGTASGVRIGRDNVFREHVTIHRGSKAGHHTVVGDRNFLMVGAHLAHDVKLGHGNILANQCLLGGHVVVGNRVFVGGQAVFHQFIRVGDFSLVQGNSGFSKDVPPYGMGVYINEMAGMNVVGLRRAGFDAGKRKEIKELFEFLFRGSLPFREAVMEAQQREWSAESRVLLDFAAAPSKKGVLRMKKGCRGEVSDGMS